MKNIIRLKATDIGFVQVENVGLGCDANGCFLNSLCVEIETEYLTVCDYKITYSKGSVESNCECMHTDIEKGVACLMFDEDFLLNNTTGDITLKVFRKAKTEEAYTQTNLITINQPQVLVPEKNWFLKYVDDAFTLIASSGSSGIVWENLYGNAESNATNKIRYGTANPSGGEPNDVYFKIGSNSVNKITYGTENPSGGNSGDVYFKIKG